MAAAGKEGASTYYRPQVAVHFAKHFSHSDNSPSDKTMIQCMLYYLKHPEWNSVFVIIICRQNDLVRFRKRVPDIPVTDGYINDITSNCIIEQLRQVLSPWPVLLAAQWEAVLLHVFTGRLYL